ncbi:hypothetical protein GQ607_017130 [Colletotrichum asianum]|uniref:Uncharacterized protein n=1 Tax=Colletotrichum asianum TaxID=702518 RepID=A0A8H3VUJ3_9PEZI|nr:hypothetical protein GQ607_017130 [Colletotrichum asianum]
MSSLQDTQFEVPSYAVGKELTLSLHIKITPQYGPSHFPWPWKSPSRIKTPFPYSVRTHPSGFDPERAVPANEKLRLCVLETLSGGFEKGPQVVLCKVQDAPSETTPHHAPLIAGMNVVLKIFDHDYCPHMVTFPRPYTHYQLADQDLSREASALRYMHRAGRDENGNELPGKLRLTGGHNLTPEYYGTWVIDLNLSSPDGKRYAGAVAMEYIDGVSMEDLCTREDEDSLRVYPMAEPQPLYDADENETHGYLDMGEHSRLKVLADIVGGFVEALSFGVDHGEYELGDFMITYLSHGKKLRAPRVVKLNYKFCQVWCMTRMAKVQRWSDNEQLPYPVHPADHFTLRELVDFCGWWPFEWWHDESQFYAWLVKEFGPMEEGHEIPHIQITDAELRIIVSRSEAALAEKAFSHVREANPVRVPDHAREMRYLVSARWSGLLAARELVKRKLAAEEQLIRALTTAEAERRLNRPELEADIKSELDALVSEAYFKELPDSDEEGLSGTLSRAFAGMYLH